MAINQNALYYARMASSIGDKVRLLPYLKGTEILEIGFGGAELLDILSEDHNVYGLDASHTSVCKCDNKKYCGNVCEAYADEILDHWKPETFDSIIMSSVLHEVFSYGGRNNAHKHSLQALSNVFHEAYDALKPGGRMLIRDGVLSPAWAEPVILTMKNGDDAGVEKYLAMQPFKDRVILNPMGSHQFSGNIESVAAFAYTYTWGINSYPRETQELFSVLTLEDYAFFMESHGFVCIHKEEYVQQGYVDALSPMIDIRTVEGTPLDYPPTNAIWIMEKV